jgi:hypothetical protein
MSARTASRARSSRGAAVVEAAIVLPLFIAFVFCVAEFGLLWHTKTQLDWSSRAAALDLARGITGDNADVDVLGGIDHRFPGGGRLELMGVMVFAADSAGAPSTACAASLRNVVSTSTSSTGVGGVCNVYPAALVTQVRSGATPSGFGGSCSDGPDRWFCPANRTALASGVGVAIRVRYRSLTGLLPVNVVVLTERSVMEPI